MGDDESSRQEGSEHPHAQSTILAQHQTQATIQIPRRPLTFLAIDGTASPDADAFAQEMGKITAITPKRGSPRKIATSNLADKLLSNGSHPLSRFVRRSSGTTLAFDFQRRGSDIISSDNTADARACKDLFKKGGVVLDGDTYSADVVYIAMHANLRGTLSFCPDEGEAQREDWYHTIHLFNPVTDELDWLTVKWAIFASCGSLSLHYRYFGIPGHARDTASPWAHKHQLFPSATVRKYVLSTWYPGLQWLRAVKRHAPKLHGILGFWDKSPGGDVGGFPDVVVAKEFVQRLKRNETFLEAWKQHGGAQTWAWAAIVDEKYKDETLEDLITNRLGDPGERRWMYANLYTGPPSERITKPVPIPIKEAFLEANRMEKYTERPPSGVLRLHSDLAMPLRRNRYYPSDLMQRRSDPNVSYPRGDIVESFALGGKHYSSLSTDEMRNLLKEAIDESGRELKADELKSTYRPIKVLMTGFLPWRGSGLNYNTSQIMAQYMDERVMRLDTDIGPTLVYNSGIVLPVWWYDAADRLVEEVKLGYPDIVIGLGMKGFDRTSTDPYDSKVEIEVNAVNTNEQNIVDDKFNVQHPTGRTSSDAIEDRGGQNSSLNRDSHTTDPVKVRDDGPSTLPNSDIASRALLPYDDINEALNAAPDAISSFVDRPTAGDLLDPFAGNPGTYMCNQIFYNLLYHNLSSIGQRKFKYDVMAGFIHIPALPNLPPAQREARFRKTAETIVQTCVAEYVKREMYKVAKPMSLEGRDIPLPGNPDLLIDFYEWDLDVWGG